MEITRTGDLIVINQGGRKTSEHLDNFTLTRQGEDFLFIGESHKITSHNEVTNITSTSLEDLHNKLNTLIQ